MHIPQFIVLIDIYSFLQVSRQIGINPRLFQILGTDVMSMLFLTFITVGHILSFLYVF